MSISRYPFMDGARGLAALFILVRHTSPLWSFHFYRTYLAVDLFFMLSGFVISCAYDAKLTTGAMTKLRFLLVRAIRLYPMFVVAALVSAAVFVWHPENIAEYGAQGRRDEIVAAVLMPFMIPWMIGADVALFPMNGPFWSLLFEMLSNIAFAAAHSLLTSYRLIATVAASFVLVAIAATMHGNLDIGWTWGWKTSAGGFMRAIFGLFFGVLLQRSRHCSRGLAALQAMPWLGLLLIVMVLASPRAGAADPLVDLLCVALVFPACVLSLTGRTALPGAERTLLFLGSASYPLYALHIPLGALVIHATRPWLPAAAPWIGVAFAVVLISLCATLEMRVDVPVRRWLSRALPRSA